MEMIWSRADRPESVGLAPNDVRDRLAGLSIFRLADSEDIEILARGGDGVVFDTGKAVIKEGRIPSYLYVVVTGELEVWSSGDEGGEQRLVNRLGEGDHFGEVGLLEGMPSTATVKTVTRSSLIRITATSFLEVLARSPAITAQLAASAGGALARSHPTYRLAAEDDGGATDPREVVARTAELLRSLPPDEGAAFRASLEDVLSEEG